MKTCHFSRRTMLLWSISLMKRHSQYVYMRFVFPSESALRLGLHIRSRTSWSRVMSIHCACCLSVVGSWFDRAKTMLARCYCASLELIIPLAWLICGFVARDACLLRTPLGNVPANSHTFDTWICSQNWAFLNLRHRLKIFLNYKASYK
jgi:hypothetical protein